MTEPNPSSKVSNPGDSLHGIIRLLPCPFCGLTDKDAVCPESTVAAVHAQDYYAMSSVICEGCQTTGPRRGSREQAIEAWNTRKKQLCDHMRHYISTSGHCMGCGELLFQPNTKASDPKDSLR